MDPLDELYARLEKAIDAAEAARTAADAATAKAEEARLAALSMQSAGSTAVATAATTVKTASTTALKPLTDAKPALNEIAALAVARARNAKASASLKEFINTRALLLLFGLLLVAIAIGGFAGWKLAPRQGVMPRYDVCSEPTQRSDADRIRWCIVERFGS